MLLKSLLAFLCGAVICAISQILIDKTRLTPAKILVCLVIFGSVLGALGLYEPLFKIFGCGISVPLVGFGSTVINGVRDAVDTEGFIGIFKGAFSAMGAGTVLCLFMGFLSAIFVRASSKKL